MQGLRLGGHPLHPALVHFPVACWSATPLLDLAYVLTQNPAWWQAGFWCLLVGTGMGLLAMCAGLADLLALPTPHPAEAVGQRHMLLMGSAWCLFVVDILFRRPDRLPTPMQAWGALGLSAAGFLFLAVGAYAGARLVYDFGVGRNPHHSP